MCRVLCTLDLYNFIACIFAHGRFRFLPSTTYHQSLSLARRGFLPHAHPLQAPERRDVPLRRPHHVSHLLPPRVKRGHPSWQQLRVAWMPELMHDMLQRSRLQELRTKVVPPIYWQRLQIARQLPHLLHPGLRCEAESLMLAYRSRIRDLGCRFTSTKHMHIESKPSTASLSRLHSMHGWLAGVPFSL